MDNIDLSDEQCALDSLKKDCLACRRCAIGGRCLDGSEWSLEPDEDGEYQPIGNVFSTMNVEAEVMVVGQNPGADEVGAGEPFVGASGRVFNEALQTIVGISREDTYITNVVKCLRYNTRVLLADGSWRWISHLVREKFNGEVMSLGPDGELQAKRVLGWHKSPMAGRRFFKLTHPLAKNNSRGRVGPVLTEDHPILTADGYKAVSQLTEDDVVAIGEPYPNDVLCSVLTGTILGDAHLCRSTLQVGHSIKQKAYCEYLSSCFESFGLSLDELPVGGYQSIRFRTLAHSCFRKMRSDFYPKGRKSPFVVKELDDVAVAVWYMDDGYIASYRRSPRAAFATNSFKKDEVQHLCNLLGQWGVQAHPVKSNGWRVSVGVGHADVLFRRIAPYVHPSMRCKLPECYQDVPFKDFASLCGVKNGWIKGPVTCEVSYPDKSVYCIDVEDNHNFIVQGGIVVHNCYTQGNRKPTQAEIDNCRDFLDLEIKLVEPKVIVALGSLAFKALTGMSGIMKHCGTVVVSPRYMTPVVAMLHPSPYNTNNPERMAMFKAGMSTLAGLLEE